MIILGPAQRRCNNHHFFYQKEPNKLTFMELTQSEPFKEDHPSW